MPDDIERRPKLPRNAPINSVRKRTCIEPLVYLVIESAPFAPIDFAQDGPSGRPCFLLSGTCEWFPIVLMFTKLCTVEVLMRRFGDPNATKLGPWRFAHCELNGAYKHPLDYAL